MTKEPIMIDGVDITECEHIDFDCANCEIFANMCHENTNCYYKQLQKEKIAYKILLEIHNEDIAESNKEREELLAELKRKEQECDQLKAELKPFKDEYFKGLDNITISELAKKSIRITAENRKFENALQEIKEIAEKHAPRCAVSCPHDDYKCEICMLDDLKKILQKCEVLDD